MYISHGQMTADTLGQMLQMFTLKTMDGDTAPAQPMLQAARPRKSKRRCNLRPVRREEFLLSQLHLLCFLEDNGNLWRIHCRLGNGSAWDTKAADAGYTVSTIPKVGAIAQWDNVAQGMGHVAYVLEVGTGANADKVRVAEYNWSALGGFSNTRWTMADHYIHIGDPCPPTSHPTCLLWYSKRQGF